MIEVLDTYSLSAISATVWSINDSGFLSILSAIFLSTSVKSLKLSTNFPKIIQPLLSYSVKRIVAYLERAVILNLTYLCIYRFRATAILYNIIYCMTNKFNLRTKNNVNMIFSREE